MEYLLLHRRGLTYEYTLLWDGGSGEEAHLCGLLDVDGMEIATMDSKGKTFRSDKDGKWSPLGRDAVGGQSGGRKSSSEQTAQDLAADPVGVADNAVIRKKNKVPLSPSPLLSNSSS